MTRPSSPRPQTLRLLALCSALALAFSQSAHAAPTGASVVAGSASVSTQGASTVITQTSQSAILNWQSFGIKANESAVFIQPNASSVALNRVIGSDPSAILGSLSSNGRVYLVNPNGVLFGAGAQVNVGSLVASSMGVSDADFLSGSARFSASGEGASVINQGSISANGGYVALIGKTVENQGSIVSDRGAVALAAGSRVSLEISNGALLSVSVDAGASGASIANGGLIQADGGRALLSAKGAGDLIATAVSNSGMIRARTLDTQGGVIRLLSDARSGEARLSGSLDASAPNGGPGGFIETSAARVSVAPGASVDTRSANGAAGHWLIDPQDFTVGGGATDNISGSTLSGLLVTNNVTITTQTGPDIDLAGPPPSTTLNTAAPGNGDIHINQAISWTASGAPTTLSLNALRDVNINQAITAVDGNVTVCCGRDINASAAISATRGSVSLNAGRSIDLAASAPITVVNGNLALCSAQDISIASALTLTRGTSLPERSLGLAPGVTLAAGVSGVGPGINGGQLLFSALAPKAAITGPNADVTINYNPISYTTPSDFAPRFTLTGGAILSQRMLVFAANGDKAFDGSSAATLSGLKGAPGGVSLVAGPGASASYDTPDIGIDKTISYSGYTLSGSSAGSYALAVACCGPAVAKTTGTISAVAPPPVVIPPVVTPPVVVPPVVPPVTPPVVTPPVVVPPVTPPVVVPPVVVPPVVTPPVGTPPAIPPVVTPPIDQPPAPTTEGPAPQAPTPVGAGLPGDSPLPFGYVVGAPAPLLTVAPLPAPPSEFRVPVEESPPSPGELPPAPGPIPDTPVAPTPAQPGVPAPPTPAQPEVPATPRPIAPPKAYRN